MPSSLLCHAFAWFRSNKKSQNGFGRFWRSLGEKPPVCHVGLRRRTHRQTGGIPILRDGWLGVPYPSVPTDGLPLVQTAKLIQREVSRSVEKGRADRCPAAHLAGSQSAEQLASLGRGNCPSLCRKVTLSQPGAAAYPFNG